MFDMPVLEISLPTHKMFDACDKRPRKLPASTREDSRGANR
jgi:hypothetical protein